jgi:hypothetical protein
VPKAYHGVLHPVLVTAVVANAGLALQGKLLGISYAAAQKAYLAKVRHQGQLAQYGAGRMGSVFCLCNRQSCSQQLYMVPAAA